jgi:hypothetical protein
MGIFRKNFEFFLISAGNGSGFPGKAGQVGQVKLGGSDGFYSRVSRDGSGTGLNGLGRSGRVHNGFFSKKFARIRARPVGSSGSRV